MKRFSCLLLTIAISLGLATAEYNEKNSVFIKNSLAPNNVLKVRCTSVNDDLGIHLLRNGETYDFSFHDSVFNCVLWQGPNLKLHAKFTAYEGGGKKNYWDAREDGVYFTNGDAPPKFKYEWGNYD